MRLLRQAGFLTIAIALPLQAQRLQDASVAAQREVSGEQIQLLPRALTVSSQTSASTGSMVTGGIVGGVLGAVGGAMIGMSLEHCERSDDPYCGIGGGVVGGILGEAVGVPIGVNWVGGGKGKLSRTIPASIGLTFGCLLTGGVTFGLSVLALPPLQIYTSIRTERSGR